MSDDIHVKKLDRKSRIKPTIKFYSYKNNIMLFCESYFEMDCCLYREFDSDVLAYTTQPMTYSYDYYGKTRTYTPDALVKYKDGTQEFEEIKPLQKTQDKKFIDKFEFLKALHQTIIKVPLVLNTGKFESQVHKVNCYQLYNCLAMPFDMVYWKEFFDYLPYHLTLKNLQAFLKQSSFDGMTAFQLIANGFYLANLNVNLSTESILEKNHGIFN